MLKGSNLNVASRTGGRDFMWRSDYYGGVLFYVSIPCMEVCETDNEGFGADPVAMDYYVNRVGHELV